ncbi:Putative F-box/LRR-repeat protein At5g02700 [Linum grandiflorum]
MMRNKRRVKLGRAGFTSTDWLSELPNATLDHILSFVDTKTVVQTSVLSRRWRFVWKHVPALDLDYYSFDGCLTKFARFVDKVLSLRHPLNVNRIRYRNGCPADHWANPSAGDPSTEVPEDPLVVRVFEYAVSHGTSHLMVDLDYDIYFTYSFSESYSCVFECDLKTLSLQCFELDNRFQSFGFRALTDIRLVACHFRSDQELLDPFSEFPCLKNLVLDTCNIRLCTRFRISGQQLHNLELLSTYVEGMEISAPKLKSFKHTILITPIFTELDLPSLDHADIQEIEIGDDITEEEWDFLFRGCHNVKSLTLCHQIIKIVMNNKGRIQLTSAGFTSTDWLSQLPDAILDHILSFVDTKTVVQTSVLSRQWRYVWKHVPALNLDYNSFGCCLVKFASFVDKVLLLRHPLNVNRIRYWNGRWDHPLADPWADDPLVASVFEYAVSHGTKHLMVYMDYSLSDTYRFPESYSFVSECDLKTLSLRCFHIDNWFQSFGFRVLTEMRLVACTFRSDQEPLDPFSEFPCLKNLVLDTCDMGMCEGFRISGLQLHNVELLVPFFGKMEISAPKLKSFKLEGIRQPLAFTELDLPSLDHADIQDIDYGYSDITEEEWDFLFRGCRNVKSLTLCNVIIEALCEISDFLEQQPCPFTRLETLNLRMKPKNIPYKVMSYFFKGSSCASPSINII